MKFFIKQKNMHGTSEKGFTLLFAVLVSTLVVAIGATVVSIAVRQTVLSGTTRESQYAFYAANTVLECAFYWDVVGIQSVEGSAGVVGSVFQTPNETPATPESMAGTVRCAGSEFKEFNRTVSGSQALSTFMIDIKPAPGSSLASNFTYDYCAKATVRKTPAIDGSGLINVTIEAKGYNVPCASLQSPNPRTVERGLIQSYQS